ncbi:efflux RND transporter permease subunit [Pontibacillus salicampi]|uniref:Efflux RND transporter permease subunit n=1 Tax=Pontibacillus salicampi TaxID=1449801 RepID=A0ABV6LRR6_9BACI
MKNIINFSMNNKFAVWLLTIIITAAGLYSGLNMKLETIPDIEPPVITVTTVYPGATPAEVADEISEPLEEQIQNLSGMSTVSSTSYQNASNLQLEYSYDKDLDEAEDELKEAVSNVQLPDDAQEPSVSRVNFNAFPVISMSVLNDGQSLEELTNKVEEDIIPQLEGLEGVASVQVSGQQVKEVQLEFDENALQERGMDQQTVQQIIQGSNVNFPLGLYTFEDTQKSVVVDGNVSSLEDLKQLNIPMIPSQGGGSQAAEGSQNSQQQDQAQAQQGQAQAQQASPQGRQTGQAGQQAAQPQNVPTVELQEIANIEVEGKAESISRTNGKESITIQIVKSQEANTVDVVNLVKEKADEFEGDMDGMEFVTTFDQGEPIEDSVKTMLNKALFGGLFAIIVILMFLRNFRTTLISVVSIPLSLLIAILILNQMGITLNIMTLGAMTVAIGRVVDDSIVVVENIYRRMALPGETLEGKDLIRAATKEMFMPILSSTIVTIAVFLPLGLVEGVVGQIFLPFALTVVFALLASLVVAVTIVPMMSHSLLKKEHAVKGHQEGGGRLAKGYRSVLNSILNHKIISSIVAIGVLAGSIAMVPLVGVSFLPAQEEKMVMPTYSPAPGQTIEDVEAIAEDAQQYFDGKENVQTIQYSVGGENPMNPGASNQAAFFIEYDSETENFADVKQEVMDDLKAMTNKGEWANQDFSSTGSSNEIQVQVFGDSTEEIKPVVEDVTAMMSQQDNLRDVDSSLSATYEEYTLVAQQEKLSELGLTAGQVGQSLSQNGERPKITTIKEDGEELQVYLEVSEDDYNTIDELTDKEIQSPLGQRVPISEVVEVKEGTTEDTINRRNDKVYASVSAQATTDDIGSVSSAVQEELDTIEHPSSVDLSIGGVTEDINESFTQLGLAMLAAIAIVYLVLVIFFGGALAPFAILFSLPFTIIGAVIGLLIGGETLSISAMIGALMLIGIVVTNGIVLIDRVIHKEKEGLSTRDALLDAGMTRLRPILMTALATIGALLPLALGFEGGSIISKGLGITVIGGLASSTLLTLLIVPLVYEMLSKFRKKQTR